MEEECFIGLLSPYLPIPETRSISRDLWEALQNVREKLIKVNREREEWVLSNGDIWVKWKEKLPQVEGWERTAVGY